MGFASLELEDLSKADVFYFHFGIIRVEHTCPLRSLSQNLALSGIAKLSFS